MNTQTSELTLAERNAAVYVQPESVRVSKRDRDVRITGARRRIVRFRLTCERRGEAGWYRQTLFGEARRPERVEVVDVHWAVREHPPAAEDVVAMTGEAIDELRAASRSAEVGRLSRELGAARSVRQVPVAVFQRRFFELAKRDGLTLSTVAQRLGWQMADGRGDTSRVSRRLGLMPALCSHRKRMVVSRYVQYDTAVALCEALELEPHEVGV